MKRSLDLSPKKMPTQARAKETYAAIVKAAARILEKRGYEALTTNHVAEEAGIGVASLYEYFPNKRAVVAAVVTKNYEDILGDIERALGEAFGKNPVDALSNWVTAMFDAVEKRKRLVAVLMTEVPFLHEVPAARSSRDELLELARRGRALSPQIGALPHVEALTYLLPLMVSHAITEAVIRPPTHLTREEVQAGLVDLIHRLLLG